MKTHKQLLKEASILKQKLVQVENRIALTETRRMQKLAGLITEVEASSTDNITSKIDQNLDKIESIPAIQKAAEKIMKDPKLLQQFQQGLSKMGVTIDLMKEGEGEGEDISSSDISKIVNALSKESNQLKEDYQYELPPGASDEEKAEYMKKYPNAKKYPDEGQYAPILMGIGLTSPYWLQLFSPDLLSKVGSMIGTQAAGGGLLIAGIATAIAAIAGSIIHSIPKYKVKKPQQESIKSTVNEIRRMQKIAGILKEEDMGYAEDSSEAIDKAQIGKTIKAWGVKHVTDGTDVYGETIMDNIPEELKPSGMFNAKMDQSLIQLSKDYHTGMLSIEQAIDKAIEIVTDPSNYTTGDTVNEAMGVKNFTYKDVTGKTKFVTADNLKQAKAKVKEFNSKIDLDTVKEK